MEVSVEKVIGDVKICIDEIGLNDAEIIGDQDNEEMATIIRSKLSEALRFVNGNADWSMLDPDLVLTGESAGVESSIGDDLVGRVTLPASYLRLCFARFVSWPLFVPDTDVINWDDKEYATLSDPYATGTWERPKVAFTNAGKRVLELYKAKSHDDSFQVALMLEPEIHTDPKTKEETVSVSSRLYSAIIYYIAGLVLMTYGEQRADDMFNQALAAMGIKQAIQSSQNINQ